MEAPDTATIVFLLTGQRQRHQRLNEDIDAVIGMECHAGLMPAALATDKVSRGVEKQPAAVSPLMLIQSDGDDTGCSLLPLIWR